MTLIITAIAVVTVIGVICAVMLSAASKVMAVEVDERIPQVRECLPGANCGGCGYPGCDGYAAALVADEGLSLTLCAPGGAAAASAISAVLGREAGEMQKRAALVHCGGDCEKTKKTADFAGSRSCAAAKLLFSGDGACGFGCLGYGDCAGVCPEDAICVKDGLARVIAERCIACGKCVKTCPQHLISLIPESAVTAIRCSSRDKGPAVKAKCAAGCIGCGLCSKKCPEGAIAMEDNLPGIDDGKCTGCGACAQACPVKCIHM